MNKGASKRGVSRTIKISYLVLCRGSSRSKIRSLRTFTKFINTETFSQCSLPEAPHRIQNGELRFWQIFGGAPLRGRWYSGRWGLWAFLKKLSKVRNLSFHSQAPKVWAKVWQVSISWGTNWGTSVQRHFHVHIAIKILFEIISRSFSGRTTAVWQNSRWDVSCWRLRKLDYSAKRNCCCCCLTWGASRLSGWGWPNPPVWLQSPELRWVVGPILAPEPDQNQPFTLGGWRSGRLHPLKLHLRPDVQI